MKVDFLVIGQGLAGSLLAWELIQRGKRVIVIDSGQENASQIAGGLINPVTGMRLVKSDDIDDLLNTAITCYRNLERHFDQRFYRERPMLRLLRNQPERNYAQKRLADPDYRPFIGQTFVDETAVPDWLTPFGVLEQQQTGNVQTRILLTRLKEFFIDRDSYRQSAFDYPQLQITAKGIHWNKIGAHRVIFCEGYRCSENPWFSWLPLKPVKGEIITCKSTTALPDKIFNYGNWLIPSESSGHFRTGATFDRERIDTIPTETGKLELLAALQSVNSKMDKPLVVAHYANIRPCTPDKQAFVGHHPEHRNLTIFNGFGAKGSLLIPRYSQNLADHLIHQQALLPSANINRYYDSHFPGRTSA